jgi:hypothetical protein
VDFTAETYCMGLCQKDSDCPSSQTCDPYFGLCGRYDHPETGDVGAACAQDSDCKSQLCVILPEFPGGYCSAFCSLVGQGCPQGSVCALRYGKAGDLGTCFRVCSSTADCRQGYGCVRTPVLAGVRVCGPAG